ncbi:MAG: hypothetical protein K8R89_02450 [Anaerolineae bacterium]|nr:hypothetical protein [Anaerolineae bacterium]
MSFRASGALATRPRGIYYWVNGEWGNQNSSGRNPDQALLADLRLAVNDQATEQRPVYGAFDLSQRGR